MDQSQAPRVAVIGGGPAGLMAADAAVAHGVRVDLYERLGSVGRKFLLAGKGGLNLTHAEARPAFDARYGARRAEVGRWLDELDADALREWARGLGVQTFVGSSGRVFPADLKAAPLLRRLVHRLRERGVQFHVRHRWLGWSDDGALRFEREDGTIEVRADATVLAFGGASWPVLGSDGSWSPVLAERGVEVAPMRPANCGFDVAWSAHFTRRHAGDPVKPVRLHWRAPDGSEHHRQGELVVTASGVEGSLIYAYSAQLRDAIEAHGSTEIRLDLATAWEAGALAQALSRPAGKRSFSEHLRRTTGIVGVKAGLLREALSAEALSDPQRVAATLKSLPLRLLSARPVDEAISTAGGVRLEAMDESLMLHALPGTYCAGEMLDWEAPTGGYLLNACFASGRIAGRAAARHALLVGKIALHE